MTPGVTGKRLASIYSGIGTLEEGLKRAGVKTELACYAESDGSSSLAYSVLHGTSIKKNWKDPNYIDGVGLRNIDLLVHSAPYKSRAEGSKDMWEAVRILEESRPRIIVWETSPSIVFKKNLGIFEAYLKTLGGIGYRSYFKIINANDHGSPQKRRSMFVVSMREDVKGEFHFPESENSSKLLSAYLENDVPFKYTLPLTIVDQLVIKIQIVNKKAEYHIRDASKLGFQVAQEGDGIDWSYCTSKTKVGRVSKYTCQALKSDITLGTIHENIPRFFTPREFWRLQGFSDKQIDTINKFGLTDAQLYRLAGRSGNVDVSTALFKTLKQQGFL